MTDSDSESSQPARITATVKWFDPDRGFGFLMPDDGSPEVFCHVSAVEPTGHDSLPLGATVSCDVVASQRGPKVSRIHAVDAADASPDRAPKNLSHHRSSEPERRDHEPAGAADEITGSVKFFNAGKGYGFVIPDDGGQDVFVMAGTLAQAGLADLAPLQRVRVKIRRGSRGPRATDIALIGGEAPSSGPGRRGDPGTSASS